MPTLLASDAEIEEQVNRLELHYLANLEGDIHFALLSDWMDAPAETMPADERLLEAAIEGIARLNRRHGPAPDAGARFLLLHRRRVWNDSEGKWMGWERKRGKLQELNRLLLGRDDTTFMAVAGWTCRPPVRYVITLDADTRLPRGAAIRLVGTMAHPLNRPVFDARAGRVVEGYAVLQPRITPTMPTDRDTSLFQRLIAGPAGIDPYAAAISDVYQDLFGEGSYTGKGIYDVEAFAAALEGRVPENALLSHDLFEGIFARAGLVTDIELFEEFPTDYEVAAARQHRWARGDWQLLPWIVRGGAGAGAHRSGIPPIDQWKMVDNLRRTLSAPAAWLTLVAGWTLPHRLPLVWTTFVLAAIAIPALLPAFAEVIPRRSGISKRTHIRAVGRSFALAASQIALWLTFMAHQAWLMGDAIGRTLIRVYGTHRRLLEWMTAAQAKSGLSLTLAGAYRRMRGALILAVVAGLLVVLIRPGSWPIAAPFLLLWALSPLVARWVSRPPRLDPTQGLSAPDARLLRSTARRTWRFFEAFVGPGRHVPAARQLPGGPGAGPRPPHVADQHRAVPRGDRSPPVISAGSGRWRPSTGSRRRSRRWAGSSASGATSTTGTRRPTFARWSPATCPPWTAGIWRAISSFSGMPVAGALERPLLDHEAFAGIEDAVLLVREAASALVDDRRTQTVRLGHLDQACEALVTTLRDPPRTAADWVARLGQLAGQADALVDIARTLTAERGDGEDSDVLVWAQATRATIASHRRDLGRLMPWAAHLEAVVAGLPPESREAVSASSALCSSFPTLAALADLCESAVSELTAMLDGGARAGGVRGDRVEHVQELIGQLEGAAVASRALVERLSAVARVTKQLFDAMEFGFLFDSTRKIFSIGYRVTDGSLDPSAYDLLASEARLASFIAIAKGDVARRRTGSTSAAR